MQSRFLINGFSDKYIGKTIGLFETELINDFRANSWGIGDIDPTLESANRAIKEMELVGKTENLTAFIKNLSEMMFDFYKIDPFIINMNQKKNSNSMSDYIYAKIDTEIIKIIENDISTSVLNEFDINMLVLPGIIHRLHSSVSVFAKDMCEDRQDCFYVMDGGGYSDSISTVVNSLSSFDSNYVATYHPWVKILDTDKNKPVWCPPSVVLPGVIAFNDSVAAEWYAPAGLNRGGLSNVIEVKTRLTHEERDTLYTNRINPIATFPGQGATVFGQKTLQAKPSALDRINVRRLMIAVKKYIASSTRYLVFENNTAATRNRFLSIVNPYLESIQQRNGLYAFRVVMDETNNTPDVIDRNVLVGEIFLQPTKTAEFIVLDFNILPTGATFPGA